MDLLIPWFIIFYSPCFLFFLVWCAYFINMMSQIIRGVAGYLTYQYIGNEENPSTSLGKLRRLHLLQTRLRWPDIDVNTTSTLKPKTSRVATTGGSTGSTEVRWAAAGQLRKQHGIVGLQDSDSLQWIEMVMVGVMIRWDEKWFSLSHLLDQLPCTSQPRCVVIQSLIPNGADKLAFGTSHACGAQKTTKWPTRQPSTNRTELALGTWARCVFFWEALWWTKPYTKNHSPSQLGW